MSIDNLALLNQDYFRREPNKGQWDVRAIRPMNFKVGDYTFGVKFDRESNIASIYLDVSDMLQIADYSNDFKKYFVEGFFNKAIAAYEMIKPALI